MAVLEQSVKNLLSMLEPKNLLQNTYLFYILSLFLVLYGPRLQPKLPPSLRNLFNSIVFRAIILFLIAYMSSKNIRSSIIISIIFLVSINILHTNNILESFQKEGFEIQGMPVSGSYIEGPPVSACDIYNPESINFTGTAFYPINDDNKNNNI